MTFRQAEAPAQPKELYFSDLIDTTFEHDDVALFSGGIDFFAGSAHDIVKLGGRSRWLDTIHRQKSALFNRA